uniref:Uncharacterized protein n=1 Tax=Culex tarsalis TaxID=7177 RepID=A0A1Q3FJI1_CULTA
MVQDKSQQSSYSSSYKQQPENKSAFGNAQKMKFGSSTAGSNTFGKKEDHHGKANAAWGSTFKSRDHFVSMHFS